MKLPRRLYHIRSSTLGLAAMGALLIAGETILTTLSLQQTSSDRLGLNTSHFFFLAAALGLLFVLLNLLYIIKIVRHEAELELAKRVFLSLASHQLRTPANAVKNILSILIEGYAGTLSPEQRNYITAAQDSNERQLKIVESLIYAAQLESDQLTLAVGPVDMAALVRQVVAEQTSRIEARHLTVRTTLKPASTVGDSICLRMMIEHLLTNAIKYTPEHGKITVTLQASNQYITLKVTDTGIGINNTGLPQLFEKFSRLNNSLSTQAGGTGLGLYITKRIVQLHKGSVDVTSRVGKGSTFTVTLPVVEL